MLRKTTACGVLATLLALTSCTEGGGQSPITGPQHNMFATAPVNAQLVSTKAPYPEPGVTVTATIGRNGGMLIMPYPEGSGAAYKIVVPRGAVARNTVFTMTALPPSTAGDKMILDITAIEYDAAGRATDVGARGFPVPLLMVVSRKNALLERGERPVIVWLKDDGGMESVPTQSDAHFSAGLLPHLSRWALAHN